MFNEYEPGWGESAVDHLLKKEWRIRKITPREAFRLQGWSDDYIDKALFINSDSQLYKQAGNGVTVNVIEAIGKKIGEQNEP